MKAGFAFAAPAFAALAFAALAFAALAFAALAGAAPAGAEPLITAFDPPGSTATSSFGINREGAVAG